MKKKKTPGLFLTVLPLYVFTICFVVGPLLYMIALSFATLREQVLPPFGNLPWIIIEKSVSLYISRVLSSLSNWQLLVPY